MNLFHKKAADNKGFTMIEVIAVLIILGIITAIAVSRGLSTQQDLIPQADIVKSHLRFAQLKALQDDEATWGINFSSSTTYSLFTNGNTADTMTLPGEDAKEVDLAQKSPGMTITTGIVSFDSWGRPCTNAAGTILQSENRTIAVSLSGQTETITITQNTGFIP